MDNKDKFLIVSAVGFSFMLGITIGITVNVINDIMIIEKNLDNVMYNVAHDNSTPFRLIKVGEHIYSVQEYIDTIDYENLTVYEVKK